MLNKILAVADLYGKGLKDVQDRREQWLKQYEAVRDHLKEIADHLNANAQYKQGFFVDTLHAFNEDIKGTSSRMPSVSFRSGEMPMLVTFRNSMGEKRSFVEQGFHISFNPTITGQVIILLLPHHSDLNETPPNYITLAVIDEPGKLTADVVDEIIARGMEAAFYTSFTGMSEQSDEDGTSQAAPIAARRNPIGFKRYETTEKVQ